MVSIRYDGTAVTHTFSAMIGGQTVLSFRSATRAVVVKGFEID
jgi:hypothetical protein